jgi:hypothetical protein
MFEWGSSYNIQGISHPLLMKDIVQDDFSQ